MIEGLEDDGVAYVMFLHHAMADGVAALRSARRSYGTSSPIRPAGARWVVAGPRTRRAALLAVGRGDRLRAAGRAATRARPRSRSPGSLRRPSPWTLVRVLRRTGEDSPLAVPIGAHRGVAFVSASLEDFRRIRAAAGEGTTSTTSVLAAIAGALRTWLGHRGVEAPQPPGEGAGEHARR